MLESNPPGIANWELIETMSLGATVRPPLPQPLIGSIDSPMPKKTHV